MKERIEKWLEDRRSVVGRKWKEEFEYMLVLVLFWGFREMIDERSKVKFVLKDVEEALVEKDIANPENDPDFYKDHPV